MTVTWKQINQLIRAIESSKCKVLLLKLEIGKCGLYDLKFLTRIMFKAWRTIISSNSSVFRKRFRGFVRRFIIIQDSNTGMYIPCFILICLVDESMDIDESKLNLSTYICWLSAWVKALQCCTNVNIKIKQISIDCINRLIQWFFQLPSFKAANKEVENIMLDAIKQHKLYGTSGILKRNRELEMCL